MPEPIPEHGTARFKVNELIQLFRAGLLAVRPIMERAGLPWMSNGTSDPWDRVQEALYDAIIGSCLEHIVAADAVQPLAPYGYVMPAYNQHSFLSARNLRLAGKPNALFDLTNGAMPFDTVVLRKLGSDLKPIGEYIICTVAETDFEIALRSASVVTYIDTITYRA